MKQKTLLPLFIALVVLGTMGLSTSDIRAESNDQVQGSAQVSTETHGGSGGIRGRNMGSLGLGKPEGDNNQGKNGDRGGIMNNSFRGIFGTVTAVSGNTITVNSKRATTTTTFLVDATNSKFVKNKATSTIASILVGDTVAVTGQVTGTNVVATLVVDGKLPMMLEKREEKKDDKKENRGERMMGRGIAGTVTAISGNTITVIGLHASTTTGTIYTVDASSAKFFKDKATTTIASILVGDTVQVEGTITGTNVVAKTIRDGALPKVWERGDDRGHGTSTPPHGEGRSRVSAAFESMGQFFKHIFGF